MLKGTKQHDWAHDDEDEEDHEVNFFYVIKSLITDVS